MTSEIISLISVIVALVAVSVTTWQARHTIQNARNSRFLPVITEIMTQFRAQEFRESMLRLIENPAKGKYERGFESLPNDLRDDAYRVCYLFDQVGIMVALGIISENIVIGLAGTPAMRVWLAMKPAIEGERAYRRRTYPSDVPPGFLTYYEHLVARIYELGASESASTLQGRIGIHQLPRQVVPLWVKDPLPLTHASPGIHVYCAEAQNDGWPGRCTDSAW